MITEIVDKNVFEIVLYWIIWYLFAGYLFKDHNLVFCLLYMIREICVFCQNIIRENFN